MEACSPPLLTADIPARSQRPISCIPTLYRLAATRTITRTAPTAQPPFTRCAPPAEISGAAAPPPPPAAPRSHCALRLRLVRREDDARVVAAEAEGVADRRSDRVLLLHVRHCVDGHHLLQVVLLGTPGAAAGEGTQRAVSQCHSRGRSPLEVSNR